MIERFERESGIARDDQPAERLDKLERQLAHFGDRQAEVVPLIAALLSISLAGRYPALELTPQEQRDRTTDLLLESVALRAKVMPVLLVLEDAQWADPKHAQPVGAHDRRSRIVADAGAGIGTARIRASLGRPPPCQRADTQPAGTAPRAR